jgi:ketosteroid isomerase-like protein
MSPTELVRRALDRLLAKDMAGFLDLFADDAVLEFPFAEPPQPARVVGRAALTAYLDGYPERLDIREFPVVVLHQTTDPAVAVAEFTAKGVTVRTGEPYELSYVAVITVRDDLVVSYRDYWSPVAAARAVNGR